MSEENNLEELRKQIVIERLRQAQPNLSVSFGMSDGKFLNRDELIEQVKNDTEMGQKIINVHIAYLKAFKKDLLIRR